MKRLIALLITAVCLLACISVPVQAETVTPSDFPVVGANPIWTADDLYNENIDVIHGLEFRDWYLPHGYTIDADGIPAFTVSTIRAITDNGMLYYRYYPADGKSVLSEFYPTLDLLEYRYMVIKYMFDKDIPDYNRQISIRLERQDAASGLYYGKQECRENVQKDNVPVANTWNLDIIDLHRDVLCKPEEYDADPQAALQGYITTEGTIPMYGFDYRPFLSGSADNPGADVEAIPNDMTGYVRYIGFFKTVEEAQAFDANYAEWYAANTTTASATTTTEPVDTEDPTDTTTADQKDTDAPTDNNTTTNGPTDTEKPADTTAASNEKSCGGVAGLVSALTIVVSIFGMAIVIKKH